MSVNQQITPQFIKQCLQTPQDYKKSILIKQAVQNNEEHLFETICITIKEMLELNDPNPPMAKLYAVRLSKELIDCFNMKFIYLFEKHTLEQFIYYSEFGKPNEELRGKTIFGENQEKSLRQIGISLARFTSECINAWALFFPETPSGQPTKFIKLQQNMKNKGFTFDTQDYYKQDFIKEHEYKQLKQNNQTVKIPNDQKGIIIERSKIYIFSCQKLLDFVGDNCSKNEQWVPDLFLKYQNEIIAKNNEVDILITQLKSINQEDLAKQIIEYSAKLKQLEKDLFQLNRETYMGFRKKYMQNKQDSESNNQQKDQDIGQIKTKEYQELHQPSSNQSSQIQQDIITKNQNQKQMNHFLQSQQIIIPQQQIENLQKDKVQLEKQLEEQRNNGLSLQVQYEQLEQEKIQIQKQLSIIQKQFNDYKINSEKLIKQQQDEHNLEINNYIIERQKLNSEKQTMLSQIEQLNIQLQNGNEKQNNQQIIQLKREIENLKQDQEIQIKNLLIQIDQNKLKFNDQQNNQENFNLQLNLYKTQLKQQQNEYQNLEERQNKERLALQQQVIDAQKKVKEIQVQLFNKEEEYKQLDSIYQAVLKENQQKKRNLESQQQTDRFLQNNFDNKNQTISKQQQFEIDNLNNQFTIKEKDLNYNQNIEDFKQHKQQLKIDRVLTKQYTVDTINKPKYQVLQCPIFFKHFPQNQKFYHDEVPQRRRPISNENLDLIFPYSTPQEYFQNRQQKKRKGKEINFIQDFYDLSQLNQENQVFFKQRCLGSQGILFENYWIEFGLSYQTQISQNKAYFTYGLYIKYLQRGKKDLKVDYLEIEKFQQFWSSPLTFSKQLVEDSNDLIEILVESNVFFQQVLTLMISLSGIKAFQISIPIYICQQIIYTDIKVDDFKIRWKKKYTSIIRTSELKLNKQIVKDIYNFMKLIPKIIIINQNKIQDFELGAAAIKLGGFGIFQDIKFLIKFEILPNDMIYIYISYQSGLSTNQKEKLEQILKGYALIFLESNYS